jgi:hypothetical protein
MLAFVNKLFIDAFVLSIKERIQGRCNFLFSFVELQK